MVNWWTEHYAITCFGPGEREREGGWLGLKAPGCSEPSIVRVLLGAPKVSKVVDPVV